ncbi:hypothetical protein FAVG1_00355 [Fusarium avenaceum]|nr:hypothetical protein FAVG1_00355 [Fusarium avenaceum]
MAGSSQNDNRTYGTYIHTFPSSLLIEGNGMQTLNDALTMIYPNGATAVNDGAAVTVVVTNATSSEPENLKELLQDNGTLKKD